MACFVIAEAGVNHNGSERLALDLVDCAADVGADAVKFQTFRADNLVARGTQSADYQRANTGQGDQYEMLRALELPEVVHQKLFDRCVERGIEFMSTPFDSTAVDLLARLGVRRIKIPSGEITNRPLIEYVALRRLPIVLSTGMCTLAEVQLAIGWITEIWKTVDQPNGFAEPITLLQCTSAYPASPTDANLRAMVTMRAATGLAVGYSDHTLGNTTALAAVALGATIVEKHFTLDKDLPGPDHAMSLNRAELQLLIHDIREVESALGSGVKEPSAAEMSTRPLVRRSIATARDLPVGTILTHQDLIVLRPASGIEPAAFRDIAGRRLRVAKRKGEILFWEDIVS